MGFYLNKSNFKLTMASYTYGRSSLKRKETCEEKFDQLFNSSSQEESSERKKLKTASPARVYMASRPLSQPISTAAQKYDSLFLSPEKNRDKPAKKTTSRGSKKHKFNVYSTKQKAPAAGMKAYSYNDDADDVFGLPQDTSNTTPPKSPNLSTISNVNIRKTCSGQIVLNYQRRTSSGSLPGSPTKIKVNDSPTSDARNSQDIRNGSSGLFASPPPGTSQKNSPNLKRSSGKVMSYSFPGP